MRNYQELSDDERREFDTIVRWANYERDSFNADEADGTLDEETRDESLSFLRETVKNALLRIMKGQ